MFTYLILVIVHVTFAALTMGASVASSGGCRRALQRGKEAFLHAATEANRYGRLSGISGVITFLTGLGLIFVRGGFGAVTPNFHAAMGIMLLAIVFSVGMMKPAAEKVLKIAQAPALDINAASAAIKKMAAFNGVLHLSWMIILFLMFFSW